MSNNNLIIKFTPAEVNLSFEPKDYAPPSPAINKLPEWYRKLSRFQTSNDLSKLFPVNDRGTDEFIARSSTNNLAPATCPAVASQEPDTNTNLYVFKSAEQ
jgi:hypothetical protein